MKKEIVFISLFILGGLSVFAQDATPKADVRESAERARIREGRASGELTNKEAAGLNAQQRHIRRAERRAKADGTVTPAEKSKLNREQNRASRNIRRQKHDSQVKP